ncbi:hypothetical protein LJB91_03515 [Bacteroidales bacterium OttesenSCG-928-L03]|nr:hypothetical protein [Bacteroidales bacterium OttesenSCG-928-L03]
MKKIYLLVTMSLLVCAGLFAQTTVDIGNDYEGGDVTTTIPANSGRNFVADQEDYVFNAEEATEINLHYAITASGDIDMDTRKNSTYRNTTDAASPYIKIKNDSINSRSYLDISAPSQFITEIKTNGTTVATYTGTAIALFSDKAPFDESSITGYKMIPVAELRKGDAGSVIGGDDIPAQTRSIRILSKAALMQDGAKYRFVTTDEAAAIIAETLTPDVAVDVKSQYRVAYVRVTTISSGDPIPKSSNNKISAATIGGKAASINDTDNTISVSVEHGTDISALPVEFTIHEKATADFTSGTAYNFADPLKIKVTAENGDVREYTLTVTVLPEGEAIAILSKTGQWEAYDEDLKAIFEGKKIKHIKEGDAPADIEAFYAGCNMIFIHSSTTGSNAALKGTSAMVGKLPILSLKVFCYNSDRWGWTASGSANNPQNSASADPGASSVCVPVYKNHNIFEGVNFTGDSLTLYSKTPSARNSIQYAPALEGSNFTDGLKAANHVLATFNDGVQTHEINLDNKAKYLMIGISQEGDSFTSFNDNMKTILKNSVEYLLNPRAYYDYVNNKPVSIDSPEAEAAAPSIYFNGQDIINPNGEVVKVYNLSGVVVLSSSLNAISASELPSGVYVAVSESGAKKFAK